MTCERLYGKITRLDVADVSSWRPDLAEGYLAGQAMERQIRRGRRRNMTFLGLGLAVLVAVLPFEVRSVWRFGAWMPWATPHHIIHCGRDYRQESDVGPRPLEQLHVQGLRQVMSGPHFQAVYAPVLARFPFDACGPNLYLRSGNGYRLYSDGLYG